MSSADAHAFGAEVRRRRREQGMNIAVLAERGRLTAGYVSSVERGRRNPSLSAMTRITEGLGVSVGSLLPGHASLSTAATEFARLFDACDEEFQRGLLIVMRALARGKGRR